jgi:hypothetical protein
MSANSLPHIGPETIVAYSTTLRSSSAAAANFVVSRIHRSKVSRSKPILALARHRDAPLVSCHRNANADRYDE